MRATIATASAVVGETDQFDLLKGLLLQESAR
jgi:hypothetical protein